jgi:ATP-dependent helicase YprA (DUF1998 family)
MQPLRLADATRTDYRRYIRTSFPVLDEQLRTLIDRMIEERNLLWKSPYVSLSRPYESKVTVQNLIDEGVLHPRLAAIFRPSAGNEWRLFWHQEAAARRILQGLPTIVSSGTGSGKTEAFLIPILEYCLRHREGEGVKALLVYPMNALANDQFKRLRGYLAGTGITFARYTGDTPETGSPDRAEEPPPEEKTTREAIRRAPPDILITNYVMLERLLVRREDQQIFRQHQVRFLVMDEVHTYGGAQGIEVACLIRRFKEHVGRAEGGLIPIGTSATVKGDADAPVAAFASKLFAEQFTEDSVIRERYEPPGKPTSLYWPTLPEITEADLDAFSSSPDDVAAQSGATRLAKRLLGEQPQDLTHALRNNGIVLWLQEQLAEPVELTELALRARSEIPGRQSVSEAAIQRELMAYLLLGAVTTGADGPILRPKVHLFWRGLEGFTRCLNPECGQVWEGGIDVCPACQSKALFLEVCRTCGQDFWRGTLEEPLRSNAPALKDGRIMPGLPYESTDYAIHLAARIHPLEPEEFDEDEDTAGDSHLPNCWVCPGCLEAFGSPVDTCTCGGTPRPLLFRPGKVTRCPTCSSTYGSREIVTAFGTPTASSISVLTNSLLSSLGQTERRLLVFADNRQDTAFQAGYLQDRYNKMTKRQLIYQIVREECDREPVGLADLPELVLERSLELGLVEEPRRGRERQEALTQETWPILAEFAQYGQRRVSLEGLGLVRVDYYHLHERVRSCEEAQTLAEELVLSVEELADVCGNFLDEMRVRRALDHQALRAPLPYEQKVGEFFYSRLPVGYGRKSVQSGHAYRIRSFVNQAGAPTVFQSYVRKLTGKQSVDDLVYGIVELLEASKLLVETRIGSAQDQTPARMVDHRSLLVLPSGEAWRCDSCRRVYGRNVKGYCVVGRCNGKLIAHKPELDNYYVHAYTSGTPFMMRAEEHSAAVEGQERARLEKEFQEGEVNVLVCTPTMELGVDIGDLPTILMRNVPPTPANYAQRGGRAGRRERIALVNTFALDRGHDNYFWDLPVEMIRGAIRPPGFAFDNERLIRRHVHSLVLEKLETQLPGTMVNVANEEDELEGLRPLLDELTRRHDVIKRAVHDAFIRDRAAGGLEWLTDGYVERSIEEFPERITKAFAPWLVEHRGILSELEAMPRVIKDPGQRKHRDRLEQLLSRMETDRIAANPLSVLAREGFLPMYALPGSSFRLIPYDEVREPLARDQRMGLTEFAPGNLVYAHGTIYRVVGIDFHRSQRPDTHLAYRRCPNCSFVSLAETAMYCPTCQRELKEWAYLEARSFVGRSDKPITSEEESRSRRGYDERSYVLSEGLEKRSYQQPGLHADYFRGAELFFANTGFTSHDPKAPAGFEVCTTCGAWRDPGDKGWDKSHAKRCPDGKLKSFHLAYRLSTDCLAIQPTHTPSDPLAALPFFVTLRHALVLGANLTLETERDEIDGFERQGPDGSEVVLFDNVVGGAGYVEQLAPLLQQAARAVCERLESCQCVTSCYRCLRTYRNQSEHVLLDKRLILPTLREITEGNGPTVAEVA